MRCFRILARLAAAALLLAAAPAIADTTVPARSPSRPGSASAPPAR